MGTERASASRTTPFGAAVRRKGTCSVNGCSDPIRTQTRLSILLREQDLTLQEVCDAFHYAYGKRIHKTEVSRWATGKVRPEPFTAIRLAALLKSTAHDLFDVPVKEAE